MGEIVNPYIAGAPVTEKRMFFGREDIFQWIENSIAGQYADHILVIHGQRRVGKTSVLKQLSNRLPKRYIPVFFDLQGRTHTPLDRFLWWLAREIVRVLKQDRGVEIPVPDKEAFSADLEYFETRFLADLLPMLDNGTLLLTFDEFDNLEESDIKETLTRPLVDHLRRLMGRQGLNFIFSIGSSGRKLENMQAAYTDFFKTALYKKISFLNEEQTHYLITRPVEGILEFDKPAVNRIYKITGGHPYFTQLVCHELFARCQRTDQRQIREADVEAILDDVVERGTVNLKFVWDEASDIEKWVLASLASLDKTDNRTLAGHLRKENIRFSESDLTSGLLHLREKDVLTPENRFVIHLLRLWLQKNRPIEQVREELTEVNPIANRYIEIGQEFKNSGQYEKAIESFQEALAVSAGNIQAQVSIALVYMDQKVYDKAVGEFEKALAIDDEDVTARSGLCEAHLALGDAASQKGRWKEAAQSYQRVLDINEEHTEARQRMAEINRQRAEKALTDGRDEDALSAFADAMKYAPEDEALAARAESVKAEKKAKVIATQIARSEKEAGSKDWEAAVHTLEEASRLAPDDPNIQKRLKEIREKLRESKLVSLRIKAQGGVKTDNYGEALKAWQEYLSLEPNDREKAEEEISRLKKLVDLDDVYNKAQQAITDKRYDNAISLLKEVIVQDENFKDTSRLLVQAIELRRSSRPTRLTLPVAKILRGLLIAIGIAGLGIGAFFAWNQWGNNLTGLFVTEQKMEKVCFITTGVDEARSYLNRQISQSMEDAAADYELGSKTFITGMVKEEYEAKLTGMIQDEKCNLILGNGTWLKDSFYSFAKENPNVTFSLIDFGYGDVIRPLPENMIEQTFKTFDSGFMAGYLAAGLTKTASVGTFGAEDSASNREYMKGFVKGVEDYNGEHNTQVQSHGFNILDGSGLFASGYQQTDLNIELHSIRADYLINTENVDVLFIVSSPGASKGVFDVANKAREKIGWDEIKIIGVDADWSAYFSNSHSYWADLCITSATKNFDVVVKDIVRQAVEGTHQGGTIEGNGSNLGVGLSPFNESIFAVPYRLKADLAQLQQDVFGLATSTGILPELDPIIQTALERIQNEEPVYQTGFDSWDFGEPVENVVIENGKLVLTSESENTHVGLHSQSSDSFAVEFEFRISGPGPGSCFFGTDTGGDNDEAFRSLGVGFDLNSQSHLEHYVYPDQWPGFAESSYDDREPNKVTLIVLGDKIAVFVNGILTFNVPNPDENTSYSRHSFSTEGNNACEFDNYRFWDLREMDPAVKIALAAIQNEEPVYQTSFDTWDFGEPVDDAQVENGKLIVSSPVAFSEGQHVSVALDSFHVENFAAEFEFRGLNPSDNGHCIFYAQNDGDGAEYRHVATGFHISGEGNLDISVQQDTQENLAVSPVDISTTNNITLLVLGDQIFVLKNGQLMFNVLEPRVRTVYTHMVFAASHKIDCEYDNFKVWDLSGVDLIPSTASIPKYTNQVMQGAITDLAWSENKEIGDLLAVAGRELQPGFLIGFSGKVHNRFLQNQNAIVANAWNPDGGGDRLAIGDTNGLVLIYRNVQSLAQPLEGPYRIDTLADNGEITDISFGDILQGNDTGNDLAASTNIGYIAVWDALNSQGNVVWNKQVDAGPVYAIDWSRTTKQILTVSANEGIQVWNASTGSRLQKLQYLSHSAVWSPDGRYIALEDRSSGTSTLEVVQSGTLKAQAELPTLVNQVIWSPDGTMIATAGQDGVVRLWSGINQNGQINSLEQIHAFTQNAEITTLVWSPDGSVLVVGDVNGYIWAWNLDGVDINP